MSRDCQDKYMYAFWGTQGLGVLISFGVYIRVLRSRKREYLFRVVCISGYYIIAGGSRKLDGCYYVRVRTILPALAAFDFCVSGRSRQFAVLIFSLLLSLALLSLPDTLASIDSLLQLTVNDSELKRLPPDLAG